MELPDPRRTLRRVALPERSSCRKRKYHPARAFVPAHSHSVWENHKETPRFAPGILASVIQAEWSTWHRVPTQTKTLPLSARWLSSFCRPGPPVLPRQEGQSACGPVLTYKAPHVTVSPPLPDSVWCVLQGPAQVSPPPGSPPARALETRLPKAVHLRGYLSRSSRVMLTTTTKWQSPPSACLVPGTVLSGSGARTSQISAQSGGR
ncbi:uncharacterized protein LOC115517677 [Lynx canadensis]|uniref:uncharacterized protein LOC115517677 n=1 Tax=Lynx canadensis TaxID=61383 RepID=UPI0011AFED02|nr:uncharacterized protein LOC115517677 [Lynx canadensis]